MPFPKPDRSSFRPNFHKNAENDVIDVGWAEGVLSDGRPYRAECWAQDQITMLTFFMSVERIELFGKEDFVNLLESEGLVSFLNEEQTYVAPAKVLDDQQAEIWSINVVIGDASGIFVDQETGVALSLYRSQ